MTVVTMDMPVEPAEDSDEQLVDRAREVHRVLLPGSRPWRFKTKVGRGI